MSQRFVAEQVGLSRDQLNRVERGQVAVRFFPAWNFCQLTKTNPLWLAFGESEGRHGFTSCANSMVDNEAFFLDVMRVSAADYRNYRAHEHFVLFEAGSVFAKSQARPMVELTSPESSPITDPAELTLAEEKNIAGGASKRYLLPMTASEITSSWKQLRNRLQKVTVEPGAKAALARLFRVTTQAVSQWLSGASAPTADTTLRLLEWVTGEEAKQKRGGSAVTRPPLKTRNRKSTSHEKAKSDRKTK